MFDSDYILVGKHATFAKYLCRERGVIQEDRANIFPTIADLMLVAPLMGVYYNRYVAERDTSSKDKSSVLLAQIASRKTKYIEVYRLVMLANRTGDFSDKDKIDQAFRHDLDKDEDNPNMEIFDAYTRGGIEVLYEKFEDAASHREDKKRFLCGIMNDFINELYEPVDLYNSTDEDE